MRVNKPIQRREKHALFEEQLEVEAIFSVDWPIGCKHAPTKQT